MNHKLLLVNSITLLFRESQLDGQNENSSELVREIVNGIKLPEISIGIDYQRDILTALKNTAITMCDEAVDHKYEKSEILQRLKVDTLDEADLYDAIYDGIYPDLDPEALRRTCLNIKRTLKNHFNEEKIAEIMNKAAMKLKFHRGTIKNMKQFVAEVCAALEPYQVDVTEKDPAIVSEIDSRDRSTVVDVFKDVKEANDGTNILITGWQGLNDMLDGGFRRGEEVVIGAMEHQWKSGFSLSIFKQIALYNKPRLLDPTKKPLLLRISFEDTTTLNYQFLYKSLVENETGKVFDPETSGLTPEEMADYVIEKLSVNGWHTRLLHVNPSMWTYKDICNKIVELEADGFEVVVCAVDYLMKIPTTGCDVGPMGHDIRNMYERIRNFMTAKGRSTLFITPHQLSPDAKLLMRDGRADFVKAVKGGGYYAGTKQLGQVADVEIFIHIEEKNGVYYLTLQRGKHRKIKLTPTEYHYFCMAFVKGGVIPDDINGPSLALKRVGQTIDASTGKETVDDGWGF